MFIHYSLIIAVLLFNLAVVAIALLRQCIGYLAKYSTLALILLALLGALRLVLPLSFPHITIVINSYVILPNIVTFLRTDIWLGTSRFELQNLLLMAWGCGFLFMLFRTICKVRRFNSFQKLYRFSDSTAANKIAQELELKNVRIAVSQDVVVPYITGVFRTWIYLPDVEMPKAEFEMILKHEYQHFKSRDLAIKLFYLSLSIVLWWNPFVHVFQRELDNLLEIHCDEVMTKCMSNKEKATYLSALAFITDYIDFRDSGSPATVSSLVRAEKDSNFMSQRVKLIKGENKSTLKQLVSIVLVVMVFFASFMFVVQPLHLVPDDELFVITPENAHIVLAVDGTYRLYVYEQFVFELPPILIETDQRFENLTIIR